MEQGTMRTFIPTPSGLNQVVRIKRRKIKPLAKDKNTGDKIATTARNAEGGIVAASARVGVRAEIRLWLRGKTSGCEGSDNGAPVPFARGRPPPS
jgi:hypothetical protein